MRSVFVFLISFVFSNFTFSQMTAKNEIAGVYYFPSVNPEGGSSLIVFEDHTFVQTYFGGMINGVWNVDKQVVTFEPFFETDPFVVYARQTDTLTKTNISFNRFENGNPASAGFKVDADPSILMKRVFNEDANCFSYPYVRKVKGTVEEINLAVPIGRWDNAQHFKVVFTLRDFNDIVIVNNPPNFDQRALTAVLSEDGLVFDGKLVSRKELESIGDDDMMFLKAYVKKKPFDEVVYKNEEGIFLDQTFPIDLGLYDYNKTTDTYVLIDLSIERHTDEESGLEYYDSYSLELFPFRRIQPKEKSRGTVELQRGSLFTAKCD